jgi:hypothetical protein
MSANTESKIVEVPANLGTEFTDIDAEGFEVSPNRDCVHIDVTKARLTKLELFSKYTRIKKEHEPGMVYKRRICEIDPPEEVVDIEHSREVPYDDPSMEDYRLMFVVYLADEEVHRTRRLSWIVAEEDEYFSRYVLNEEGLLTGIEVCKVVYLQP